MKTFNSLLRTAGLLTLAFAPGFVLAADPAPAPMPGMQQGQMGQTGQMGKRCPMMKHGGMGQMIRMPRLPAGHDKLQLQMEAEILQKVGEIQAKYANQLP
jgi:hypothetical protein